MAAGAPAAEGNLVQALYEGAPHGIATTPPKKFNADLLGFIRG